ncbi:hypothetical protein, partial [Streptomyces sp. NPDC048489]|uniref:hypothetical protein n=1 Tax=Streptomyces sp. NPDC048489 TaxID=3154504 RepID=UPI00343569BB
VHGTVAAGVHGTVAAGVHGTVAAGVHGTVAAGERRPPKPGEGVFWCCCRAAAVPVPLRGRPVPGSSAG